jgi:hypothetical protein
MDLVHETRGEIDEVLDVNDVGLKLVEYLFSASLDGGVSVHLVEAPEAVVIHHLEGQGLSMATAPERIVLRVPHDLAVEDRHLVLLRESLDEVIRIDLHACDVEGEEIVYDLKNSHRPACGSNRWRA